MITLLAIYSFVYMRNVNFSAREGADKRSCFGKILWALSLVDSTSAHRQIVMSMNGPARELTFPRIGLSVKRLSANHPGSEQWRATVAIQ